MLRYSFSLAALALLLISSSPLGAQTVRAQFLATPQARERLNVVPTLTTIEVPMPPLQIKRTGLLLTRLSPKEIERWRGLQRLVLAQDKTGTPRYPTVHALWQWADHSGQVIYVQFQEGGFTPSSTAGSMHLERFDPSGRQHTAVVNLHLSNIDQALIDRRVARPNGFVPFQELQKEERYLEVLGHELAHAQYVLTNLLRSYLVHELIETTNDLLLERTRRNSLAGFLSTLQPRLSQRDELLRELEAQAEAVEETVWRELIAAKKERRLMPILTSQPR